MKNLWNFAIVNATSEVSGQMIECLEDRKFPVGKIKFLVSSRNVGEIVDFKGKPVMVEELTHDSFGGVDIALFSAGSSLSEEFSLSAVRAGAVCIDTSSAWRMDPDVPLVVPDVNPNAIQQYTGKGIVACPNSSTIQMVIALNPLHKFGRIRRIVVSTYQSVSGTGKKAIAELRTQTIDLMNARPAKNKIFPHRIAFNCLPHTDSFCPDGYTMEEKQMSEETCKIMDADIRTTATTVYVPVFYGNCQAVNIETEKKITVDKARELLANATGCRVVDDTAHLKYPMPSEAAGRDLIDVGRIREDESIENGLNLWVVADNIRRGAATNAVQIAELLVDTYLK